MPSLVCPTASELADLALNLLPRGRAWPREPGTVLAKYWRAVAEHFAFVHQRLCAVFSEFYCSSALETSDWWLAEFGLPSSCDPFSDPCIKSTAVIEPVCASYIALAARAGWWITCLMPCNASAGCMTAGQPPGGVAPRTLLVGVDLAQSPAYAGAAFGPVAGHYVAGAPVLCGDDISTLDCLLQRIVQADITLIYVTI